MSVKGYYIIYTTVDSEPEAERIARRLVEEKLAACVSIVGGVKSVYWWRGRVEESREYMLMIKTSASKLREVVEKLKSIHPYETPEIIAVPVAAGFKGYLEWIDESLGEKKE